jgi:hypothetical protein
MLNLHIHIDPSSNGDSYVRVKIGDENLEASVGESWQWLRYFQIFL